MEKKTKAKSQTSQQYHSVSQEKATFLGITIAQ